MIQYRKPVTILLSICLAAFFFFDLSAPAISKSPGMKPGSGNHPPPTGNHNTLTSLECPKDPVARQRKFMAAYKKLLAVMGTGEGGKMDTPQKRKAYAIYKFYENCYANAGKYPPATGRYIKSLLLTCHTGWKTSHNILSVGMAIREIVPYESLKRVEISIRNKSDREFFRAMNNRMSHPAPIPPNAFGVYPVDGKKRFTDKDILDVGHEAATLVKTKYGNLAYGCKTSWSSGILKIHWKIHPVGWKCPDGRGNIFVKIVPKGEKDADWIPCGGFACPTSIRKSDKGTERSAKQAIITSRFYDRFNRKKIKEGTFSTITLVKLKQVSAKAIIIRWKGDTPNKYDHVEVSRKTIDLRKHKSIFLKPGFYRFEYNDVRGNPPAGFYGKSDLFEVKDEGDMEIEIGVNPAI